MRATTADRETMSARARAPRTSHPGPLRCVALWLAWAVAFVGWSPAGAGAQEEALRDAGRERAYLLHRPASLSRSTPAALVVMLHGGFGSARQAQRAYGWDALADREGFVVVYPDGVGRSWNAGGICCGPALRQEVDDVGFLDRLLRTVEVAQNIDARRVYLTGMSNGAAMAYRYGCQGAVALAAIGPVAGTLSMPCRPTRPVSVLAIHGLADEHVPYAGGSGTRGVTKGEWQSVPGTLAAYREAGGCQEPVTRTDGVVQTTSALCPSGREVVLIAVTDAAHQWPGSVQRTGALARLFEGDPASMALDATRTLWEFFQRHSAPP